MCEYEYKYISVEKKGKYKYIFFWFDTIWLRNGQQLQSRQRVSFAVFATHC